MRIGFVVNQVLTEQAQYTTTRLALASTRRGHETWVMGVDDFAHQPDGSITANARAGKSKRFRSTKRYLDNLQGPAGIAESICVDELDVLVMRNDPAEDATERPWAVASGVLFAQLGASRGVLVLNDPYSLANALNKTYFQHYPAEVRPRTLISRDPDAIAAFVDEQGGEAVLKPLQGSGGSSVFLISEDEAPNLTQIIEAILRDGYVVAQERLPDAADGDVRMFVIDGEPLQRDGTFAAFRRVNEGDDLRSNMHAGGIAEAVEVTGEMLALVDLARPKLRSDGMFLVGLDIVGSKLMEVNVFSPGGLGSVQRLYDVDFADIVIEAIENKFKSRTSTPASETHASRIESCRKLADDDAVVGMKRS
jgi:glutathione synthase